MLRCVAFLFVGLLSVLAGNAQVRVVVSDAQGAAAGVTVSVVNRHGEVVPVTTTDVLGVAMLASKELVSVEKVLLSGMLWKSDTLALQKGVGEYNVVLQLVHHELDETTAVAQKRSSGFSKIDAAKATQVASITGGIEGVLKNEMGVSQNSELSSTYRVRGGNFDQNMTLVEGIEVYRPFLIKRGEQEGLSLINPNLVSAVQFSAGGWGAAYADKTASVLDAQYETPRYNEFGVEGSLLGGSAYAKVRATEKFNLLAGVRYHNTKYVLGSMDTKGEYAPSFFDAQLLTRLRVPGNLRLTLFGYYAKNRYNFTPEDRETQFGTINDARQLKIYFEGNEKDDYTIGEVALKAEKNIGSGTELQVKAQYYRAVENEAYDILGEYWMQQAAASQTTDAYDQSEGVGVGGYLQHGRGELLSNIFAFAVGANYKDVLQYGASYHFELFSHRSTEWEMRDSAGYYSMYDKLLRVDNELTTHRIEGYVQGQIELGNSNLTIEPGVRFNYNNTNRQFLFSPRIALAYRASEKWNLRLGMGRYYQAPLYREYCDFDGGMNTDVKAQQEWHVVFGADYRFFMGELPFKLTMDGYYKRLLDINPYTIDNVRLRYYANNDADGYAFGVDFKINGELMEGVESWMTFGLMKTMEDVHGDGHGWIARPSDQRVQFSTMLTDHMPNNKSIGANLSLYMASGLPFGAPNTPRYKHDLRMSGYKRVDLGMYKDFAIDKEGSQKWQHGIKQLRLCIDFFNLFNISNTIGHFWVADTQNNQYAVPNYLTGRRINAKLIIKW